MEEKTVDEYERDEFCCLKYEYEGQLKKYGESFPTQKEIANISVNKYGVGYRITM